MPAGSERRGSASSSKQRPATGSAASPARLQSSRRIAGSSAPRNAADPAHPISAALPAPSAPSVPDAPANRPASRQKPGSSQAQSGPRPAAARPANNSPQILPPTPRPIRPGTRQGPTTEHDPQPGVRPLSHRSLSGQPHGSGVAPALGLPAAPAVAPARPLSNRRHPGTVPPAPTSVRTPLAATPPSQRRELDVSETFRSHRAAAKGKNKRFGWIVAGSLLGLLVLTSVGMLIYYIIVGGKIRDKERQKAAYTTWLAQSEKTIENKAVAVVHELQPIYTDIPTGRSSPELTAELTSRYAPHLRPAGATYGWCHKTWKSGNQTPSVNLAPDAATLFLATPAKAAPLSTEPVMLRTINGEPTQTGQIIVYWDADKLAPLAILTLSLAPPLARAAAGQRAPEPVPPTQFTLWYDLPQMNADARIHLDALLQPDSALPSTH